MLRLALITDIHHGEDHGTKLGSHALPLLSDFLEWVAGVGPDLIVELGDRINDVDRDTDMRLTREVAAAFAPVNTRRVHLLGNHDNHEQSRADAEAAFQASFRSHSCDTNGFHLAFWNANTSIEGIDPSAGFVFDEEDLDWLRQDLDATDLPSIVFSHVPLDSGSMHGNFYFESMPALASYADSHRVREVIERSGKVVLCLAGHTHWNTHNAISGIHYVTIHSLTESFTTWPHPTGAWARCDLTEDQIEVEVVGRDPMFLRLPRRTMDRHWISRTRSYAPDAPEMPPEIAAKYAKLAASLRRS